jgi:hypothetical protein
VSKLILVNKVADEKEQLEIRLKGEEEETTKTEPFL